MQVKTESEEEVDEHHNDLDNRMEEDEEEK